MNRLRGLALVVLSEIAIILPDIEVILTDQWIAPVMLGRRAGSKLISTRESVSVVALMMSGQRNSSYRPGRFRRKLIGLDIVFPSGDLKR